MIQCDLWPGCVVWPHFYRSQGKPITMLLAMMANKHTQDTATNSAECKIRIIPCRQKRSCCLSVTIYKFRAGVIHRQQNNSTCCETKSQRCSFEMCKSRLWQLRGFCNWWVQSVYYKRLKSVHMQDIRCTWANYASKVSQLSSVDLMKKIIYNHDI